MKNNLLIAGLLLLCLPVFSQNPRETALNFLRTNHEKFNLTATDVADLKITDEFLSKNNGLTHVWLQQQHLGLPVFNGLFGLHVQKNGQVLTNGNRFVSHLSEKAKSVSPRISAEKSLRFAMESIGFQGFEVPRVQQKINEKNYIFGTGAVSKFEIPVSLCFQPMPDGSVKLAWDVAIRSAIGSETWSIRVAAENGEILEKNDLTSHCDFLGNGPHAHLENCVETIENQSDKTFSDKKSEVEMGGAAASYRVFAWPIESPTHGSRTLVSDPHDPIASPLGWHATGTAANEKFNYTRGNNIRAYDDADSNNNPPSAANEVSGGANMSFDFPFDALAEPEINRSTAVTNLFYTTNMMHDLAYKYGMDEASGAYQINNFGNGGKDNDVVFAEALDGSGTDNANFSPAPDGQTGRIQMYKWSGTFVITVNTPLTLAGDYLSKAAPGWGAPITQIPVTGEVVVADDGSSNPPSLGCDLPKNDVAGKIVMVDRGTCEFGQKALFAEQAGAIGCIICNYESQLPNMGPGSVGGQVTIPVIAMRKGDCDLLREFAGDGLNVSLVQPPQVGPTFYDGDLDNGIISHEYGHGISNRLVGGPANTGCLGNPEQMGEGWSDFFALAISAKTGDTGAKKRAVGTYVFREQPDGGGIRRFPYSTDMAINPLTFYNVAHNTEVHSLGEIWTVVLWDLYWAMVEKHGFSADLFNGTSGNNKAMQLVMDGMKLCPCNPGFVDGRDAILMADIADFAGENQCLIWKVFARRGLGDGANQGSNTNPGDGIESFKVPLACQNELTLTKKTTTPLINPGENADFVVTVRNGKPAGVSNVVVTDELPVGLTPIPGTVNNGGQVSGNKITWSLGFLAPNQSMTLTYSAKSDPAKKSLRFHFDDLETGQGNWLTHSTNPDLDPAFGLQSDKTKSGNNAWKGDDLSTESDFVVYDADTKPVQGNRPTLRFWHSWTTQAGVDGGFVEITEDPFSNNWKRVPPSKFLRNGYTGGIPYQTIPIPYLDGFWGTQANFVDSYIDLSDYKGKNISVRYRFATNAGGGADGWYLDDFEFMDLFNYEGEACATTAEGDQVCAKAAAAGVIVNSGGTISTQNLDEKIQISVQPNPAHDFLTVSINQNLSGETTVSLISIDGKILQQQNLQNISAGQPVLFDLISPQARLPQGVYFVKLESEKISAVEKVVKQ